MDISVVIPVYNTAQYLKRCLDSVFNQEFDGTFEVIAVDDASSDDSLAVLQEYAAGEPRLKILPLKERRFITFVRSRGMEIAEGDYIMHLDSDDWYEPGTFKTVYSEAISNDADVVVFNLLRIDDAGTRTYGKNTIKERLLTSDKEVVHPYFKRAVVCSMTKRGILDNMFTYKTDINHGEDLIFMTEILLRANKILLIPDYLYAYYNNTSSTVHGKTTHIKLGIIKEMSDCLTRLLVIYNESDINQRIYDHLQQSFINTATSNYCSKCDNDNVVTAVVESLNNFPAANKDIDLYKLYKKPFYMLRLTVKGVIEFKIFMRSVKWGSINLYKRIFKTRDENNK